MRLAFAVILLCVPALAQAKPMHTPLATIVKDSPTVVIARFVEPPVRARGAAMPSTYELVVERALRGTAKGTITVKPSASGHPHFKANTRLVAFITASNEWIAAAVAFAGPSIEDGVLRASGFYDFNAHLVTPGVMTLAQLEALVVKGTPIAWTFRGPILVGSPTGLAPSKIEVTATTPKVSVRGLALAGFPQPTVDVGSWDGSDVIVTFNRTLERPLVMTGAATGKHADGSIAVEFQLDEPGVIKEADLRAYLADAKRGHPYHVLEIQKAATKIPLVMGKDIGRTGMLGTTAISSLEMSPGRTIRAGAITLTLDKTAFKARSRGADNLLFEELMAGPIKCTIATAGAAQPCTLVYVETKFATR